MSMSSPWLNRNWKRDGAILAIVLIMLSGGLCVFGVGHAMAEDMSPDLCVLMFAVSLTILLLCGPLLSGWTQFRLSSRLSVAPVRILDRPPKLATLS